MKEFSNILWEMTGIAIERESFRRIEAETPQELRRRFSDAEWRVARRLVHTGADFSVLEQLEFSPGAVEAGLAALRRGATIYSDSNMIKAGLSVAKLQKFHPSYTRDSIRCPVAEPEVAAYAAEHGITRALAAVTLYRKQLDGAIFLCGNAPLALAGLLRQMTETPLRPALIVAMPVGFVNVVESKLLLDRAAGNVPWIRMNGRRGGSPFAVATLHGIMENASS